jgi:hypothetical protein
MHTLADLRIQKVRVFPKSNGMYIDTVSIRPDLPINYGDPYLDTIRRIQPSIQYLSKSLSVSRNSYSGGRTALQITFKTRNCAFQLPSFTLVNSFPSNNATLTKLSWASAPVTGSFDLGWASYNLSGVMAAVTEADLKKGLEGLSNDFGRVQVTRAGSCFGYTWKVRENYESFILAA